MYSMKARHAALATEVPLDEPFQIEQARDVGLIENSLNLLNASPVCSCTSSVCTDLR